MSALRWTIAMVFGVTFTFLQFLLVGALNQASAPQREASVSATMAPVIVSQSPEPVYSPPNQPTQLRTTKVNPIAAAAPANVSALPNLGASALTLKMGSLLPDISQLGLGASDYSVDTTDSKTPARVRRTVEPLYPIAAQRRGIEGFVTLRLTIDEVGKVADVIVVDSEPIGVFERSARQAVRRFEFTPAQAGGVAVSTTLEKKIVFSLQ